MIRDCREPDEQEKAERERRRSMETAGSFVIDVESERESGQRPASQTAATAEGEATSSSSKARHIR